jgi:hypothetical protein
MNMIITVFYEKMDEFNKAVKGLKREWNNMQLELDKLIKRQSMCKWRRVK